MNTFPPLRNSMPKQIIFGERNWAICVAKRVVHICHAPGIRPGDLPGIIHRLVTELSHEQHTHTRYMENIVCWFSRLNYPMINWCSTSNATCIWSHDADRQTSLAPRPKGCICICFKRCPPPTNPLCERSWHIQPHTLTQTHILYTISSVRMRAASVRMMALA